MKIELRDKFGTDKRPAIILCHGPSLNDYIPKLRDLTKEYCLIGCNEWPWFYGIPPDYWVIANATIDVKGYADVMNRYRTTVVYSDSVDGTDRQWVADNLKCDYIPYDSRHFQSKRHTCCFLKQYRCAGIVPGRLTIQEELQQTSGHKLRYSRGNTVALHMMAFATLLGCNPIFVVGIELDYRLGYAKNTKGLNPAKDLFDADRKDILRDISIIRDSASKMGTNIYNLNARSTFNELTSGSLPEIKREPAVAVINDARMEYRNSKLFFYPGNNELAFPRYEILKGYCRGKIVADVGCGCGYGSYLLSKDAAIVHGYDHCPVSIEFAQENWKRENISYLQLNFESDPFPIKFDCIIGCEIIQYLRMPIRDALTKMRDGLEKNGILGLTYPEKQGKAENVLHININKTAVIEILTDLGFEILESDYGAIESETVIVARLK